MGIWGNAWVKGTGIHTRQYARAFCFAQGSKTVVLVVAEIYALNYYVRYRLLETFNQTSSRDYSFANVHLLATMTHWAPSCHTAEYMNGLGPPFSEECVKPLVLGLHRSVMNACATRTLVRLFFSTADVYYSTMNRDVLQYNYNPHLERFMYATNYDYQMMQLRIENRRRRIMGMINFVPVRANALPYHNTLVSSDSLGLASMKLESRYNPGKAPGQARYLMAFAPTNIGDSTPHTEGGICNRDANVCFKFDDCSTYSFRQHGCYSVTVPPRYHFKKAEAVADNLLAAVNVSHQRVLNVNVKIVWLVGRGGGSFLIICTSRATPYLKV